jgi:hypothetical protein
VVCGSRVWHPNRWPRIGLRQLGHIGRSGSASGGPQSTVMWPGTDLPHRLDAMGGLLFQRAPCLSTARYGPVPSEVPLPPRLRANRCVAGGFCTFWADTPSASILFSIVRCRSKFPAKSAIYACSPVLCCSPVFSLIRGETVVFARGFGGRFHRRRVWLES